MARSRPARRATRPEQERSCLVRPAADVTMQQPAAKATRPLEALNFFMADVQAGIGPFLGVFLQARGWGTDLIGTVMTIGGIAGMLATSPAGALVDATRYKRAVIIVAGVMTVLASLLLWFAHGFWMVAASQIATAVTGAALGPAIAGITLGIVKQRG